jgi:hypothetical protein
VQPEPVAGLQVGNRRDWQRDSSAGDVDLDLGADQVEAGVVMIGNNEDERTDTTAFLQPVFKDGLQRPAPYMRNDARIMASRSDFHKSDGDHTSLGEA